MEERIEDIEKQLSSIKNDIYNIKYEIGINENRMIHVRMYVKLMILWILFLIGIVIWIINGYLLFLSFYPSLGFLYWFGIVAGICIILSLRED